MNKLVTPSLPVRKPDVTRKNLMHILRQSEELRISKTQHICDSLPDAHLERLIYCIFQLDREMDSKFEAFTASELGQAEELIRRNKAAKVAKDPNRFANAFKLPPKLTPKEKALYDLKAAEAELRKAEKNSENAPIDDHSNSTNSTREKLAEKRRKRLEGLT